MMIVHQVSFASAEIPPELKFLDVLVERMIELSPTIVVILNFLHLR
jgi:hypothetical protein